jgi:hypothetical protein
MWHLSWEAIRAYLSPALVTIIALLGLWKDASDYRDLVRDNGTEGINHFAKKHIVSILCVVTILIASFQILDTHAARFAVGEAASRARTDKQTSDAIVQNLRDQVAGLRQDGLSNAKIFTESFSKLNDKFSDLQAKVKNQDLIDQLASTRAELLATQKKLEPKPKAVLEASFEEEGSLKTLQTPQKMTEAKVVNGVITVRLTLLNPSAVDGLNGMIKVAVCDDCKFAEEPALFQHLSDDVSQMREYDFQHVCSKTKLTAMTFKISVPDSVPSVLLGTVVICETCDHRRDETFLVNLIR